MPNSLISVYFGSVSAPFRVRFGSVSGPFWVRIRVLGGFRVGSGRGASVREKNITTAQHTRKSGNRIQQKIRLKNSADCKRGRRKGATSKMSKIVKKCQKVFRHFSTIFAQGKKRQKSSKSVKKFFDTFQPFSRGTIFPAPFGRL